jgi:hypothetical protein
MSETTEAVKENVDAAITENWKRRNYAIGAIAGAAFGFISAYMFTQEAEKAAQEDERPDVAPTTLITLTLSLLGLMRQIAESGKKKKD